MAYFNEFKNSISKAAQSVTNKTKDSFEITRLSSKARGIRHEISSLHEKIGRAFVESKGQDMESLSPLAARVEELQDQLAQIEAQRLQKKNQYPCPFCGAAVRKGSRFCPNRGHRMAEETADEPRVRREIVVHPVADAPAEEPSSFDAE